jgi:hypothetical protein
MATHVPKHRIVIYLIFNNITPCQSPSLKNGMALDMEFNTEKAVGGRIFPCGILRGLSRVAHPA